MPKYEYPWSVSKAMSVERREKEQKSVLTMVNIYARTNCQVKQKYDGRWKSASWVSPKSVKRNAWREKEQKSVLTMACFKNLLLQIQSIYSSFVFWPYNSLPWQLHSHCGPKYLFKYLGCCTVRFKNAYLGCSTASFQEPGIEKRP